MKATRAESQRKASQRSAEALIGRPDARERDRPPGPNYSPTPKGPTDASLDAISVPLIEFMKQLPSHHPRQARLARSHVDPQPALACLPYDGPFADGPTVPYFDTTRQREDHRTRFGRS